MRSFTRGWPLVLAIASCGTSTVGTVVVSDGATTAQDLSLAPLAASTCSVDTSTADFQTGVLTTLDATTSPGDVTLLRPSLDQQNTTTGNTGNAITTTTYGGQTFTAGFTGTLARVDVKLFCSGCTGTTPNLTVSLRNTSGGLPTGADLATATIPGFSSGAGIWYTATFASPPSLTAGTQYAYVIRPVANPSPGTYAILRSGTSGAGQDVYAGGARVQGATSGTVWSIPLTGGTQTDTGFRTYVNVFLPSGSLVSAVKGNDPATGSTQTWSTLSWTATSGASTSLEFQAAASNSPDGPFTFVGPDGTAASFFTTSGASLSQFNGFRYLKYQAVMATSDRTLSPTLSDVTVCFQATTPPQMCEP